MASGAAACLSGQVRRWLFMKRYASQALRSDRGCCMPLKTYGCLRRFAVSNAHALLLVFGGGSALGLLSWRGAGAAADAWLASARHGRGQDVGGVCIGVLRALFALPQACTAAPLWSGAAERGPMLCCSCSEALSYDIACLLGFRPASKECSGHSVSLQYGSTSCLTRQLLCIHAAWALCLRSAAVAPAQGGQHCLYDGARPVMAAAALRCKRVYLAGHGAGGALAAAFAALLHTWQDAPQVLAQARACAGACTLLSACNCDSAEQLCHRFSVCRMATNNMALCGCLGQSTSMSAWCIPVVMGWLRQGPAHHPPL